MMNSNNNNSINNNQNHEKQVEVSLEQIAQPALDEARKLECADVSVLCAKSNDSQVRFANNTITLVNNVRNVTLNVYISKQRKRILGTTYNPTEQGVRRFVDNLVKSCEALPESEDYSQLPDGPFTYHGTANFDPGVEDAPLVDFVKTTIDEAMVAGAARVSGSLNTESTDVYIETSGGAKGRDKESQILLNVRAFAEEENASGHGLSCASYLSEFEPGKAGRRAGSFAKRSVNAKQIPEGTYDVIFTPTVIANILPIATSASAFAIDSGNSFLCDRLGQKVGVEGLGVVDHGVVEHGLGGSIFDAEGTPTQRNQIVSDGVFVGMLHNCTTAKKYGKKSTGSAGIISPHPRTIVFDAGSASFEEMIRETKRGLFITNNWYTRYQNYRSGEYSTVPRDAAFRIEAGELAEPVVGFRLSDSVPRQLSNIAMISNEREWIRWWEVEIPTLAPYMMIRDVQITRAVGS